MGAGREHANYFRVFWAVSNSTLVSFDLHEAVFASASAGA